MGVGFPRVGIVLTPLQSRILAVLNTVLTEEGIQCSGLIYLMAVKFLAPDIRKMKQHRFMPTFPQCPMISSY